MRGTLRPTTSSTVAGSVVQSGTPVARLELWFQHGAPRIHEALIQARDEARANKDFGRADEIRDQLATTGIYLQDGPSGTDWRRGAPVGDDEHHDS